MKEIRSILVANRSEIAIRIFRAAYELGIRTVGIFSIEDRLALHRLKADESYLVGKGKKPIEAYLDIDDIIRIAKEASVDAIHPGYGFLSENPDFADACAKAGIAFIGPNGDVMRDLGNKIAARHMAEVAHVPVVPATQALPYNIDQVKTMANAIGYPFMLKASWGGGGRGMRIVENETELEPAINEARREAKAAFGNDEVFLEKLIRRARHVEVQILADKHGNFVHLFERDCTVQRRNQKVVERAPAPYFNAQQREDLCQAALRLVKMANYTHAGTVEFLYDVDEGKFYFIEVNPRIQVEHTVTEEVTGIDIVKAQIRITEGYQIGDKKSFVPQQDDIHLLGHALQCRVTTENPENHFTPDYGRISVYRSASGNGIRLDAGTAYTGAIISPYYDSLLVKVTAKGKSVEEATSTMARALREFRIRGLSSNLLFLQNVILHPCFNLGEYTTRFIDNTPELFKFDKPQDRASKLLDFFAEVAVNGNSEMKGREIPKLPLSIPSLPDIKLSTPIAEGSRDRLQKLGIDGFISWMKNSQQALITDTSMRDAHQSLFATRMRSYDMLAIAPYYARMLPQLFSIECWGGATFDTAMRFLKEDPWERLIQLRKAVPNILLQMLLRSSNAVGYTNYADNVVTFFVKQAAKNGVDLFRVFDSLNWVENMRVAIDAVLDSGKLCEGTICYTGDLFDTKRTKYNLHYYVKLAKQLQKTGVHILAIKDMSGVCRPQAAKALVKALKDEVGMPIHFHTHDTSGIAGASVLSALDAGCDAVDAAMDALSGMTSQPNLGSIVAALEHTPREPGLNRGALLQISNYWEGVRAQYKPFDVNIAGTSDVYNHEMPGGQYTNLREQARALGLAERWPEVSKAYCDVNTLFGDIVKVTPTSKVVGDLAVYMVVNNLTIDDVANPDYEIDFPASVVSMMRGELGFPPDGFPAAIQSRILKGKQPIDGRVGDFLPPIDLEKTRLDIAKLLNKEVNEVDDKALASYLMYPKVFLDYKAYIEKYSDVSKIPTANFFYGLQNQEEINIEIERGKVIVISRSGRSESDDSGSAKIFFEMNGQPRTVTVVEAGKEHKSSLKPKAELGNPHHVAAPMPGMIALLSVKSGQKVIKGDALLSIEAMKMETTITAECDGVVKYVHIKPGSVIETNDLLIELA
ncbi:pyruvate carboxylase [Orbus wheelerorum]|uniref:pyruvate carboxylase n=1 Tax=Orbus wheelerorum TaxID=3074111 RepID=UPI00370D8CDF